MSYEFVKAEDNYRREVLRDQNRAETKGRARKTVAALLVVGAVALAACGAPAGADTGKVANTESAILTDNGPTWEPNRALLEETLNPQESDVEVMAARIEAPEYGPMAAPSWQPDTDAVEEGIESDPDGINDIEPFGHPNYGRLETYLGAQPSSGIR
ncbi:MAG: hypothetical protein PVF87_02415 [Acidimicrobiia bacterium]